MKNIIKILCIYFTILTFWGNEVFSQSECATQDFPSGSPFGNNFFGGYLKPQRTDRDSGNPSPSNATFNMLFVFVQFQDEYVQSGEWPIGDTPTYKGRFIVEEKNSSGDYWNRYRDSSISDYYQEVSKGAFHVTGEQGI